MVSSIHISPFMYVFIKQKNMIHFTIFISKYNVKKCLSVTSEYHQEQVFVFFVRTIIILAPPTKFNPISSLFILVIMTNI